MRKLNAQSTQQNGKFECDVTVELGITTLSVTDRQIYISIKRNGKGKTLGLREYSFLGRIIKV